MAKTSSGKTSTSKGERANMNGKLLNSIRNDRDPADKMVNIQTAWLAGSNPWITIDNPNKEQTNKKKIRVRMNDLKGSSKELKKKMYVMGSGPTPTA